MGVLTNLKHRLFGKPIPTKFASHERLAVLGALPVFASDALSSTAYASEEILHQLVNGGEEGLKYLVGISLALVCLLWVVISSYYQTINAYPQGGGSYRVSSENLGQFYGLTAGAALLIGYVLTVAVSVSAAALAINAMAPATIPYATHMASAAIIVITYVNLRGAKESSVVFGVPTYSFVFLIAGLVVWGIIEATRGREAISAVEYLPGSLDMMTKAIFVLFIVKAFAAGCTALTGTEAIADGVLAFKPPEARNASRTLVMMGVILSCLFFGLSWLSFHYGVHPMDQHLEGGALNLEYKTVIAQLAGHLFGDRSAAFYMVQVATAIILVLAANTGYADFPRLSMFIARDGYMPRQLSGLGDRLVYQNGIILLAVLSILLVIVMKASVHGLLPMYAIGVFISFTLSQAGMVGWWKKKGQKSWKKYVSLFGAFICGGVAFIQLVTRWAEGAWLTIVSMGVVMLMFYGIKRHYNYLAHKLNVRPGDTAQAYSTTVLLLVPRLHRGILKAISYARALSKDVRAVHVTMDPAAVEAVKAQWARFSPDIPLVILESPYRSLVRPIVEYVDQAIEESHDPNHIVTVIVAEAVPKNVFQSLLHSNLALFLKLALGGRRNVVISNVRYFLD
ncbi:MAG TPA: APC family permease [Fimbriimonadaceae bacterium]|nr:APC family permease [Fimbriimonadaceae bacterium]